MKKLIIGIVLFLCAPLFAKYVAILETTGGNEFGISRNERQFITDDLRAEAVTQLKSYDYTIMTRENIQAMLPPDKTLEDCEGSCLVETGRNIAADYIVQGRLGKFGENLTITVELYETSSGKLVGSITGTADAIDGILNEMKQKSGELFKTIIPQEKTNVSKANITQPINDIEDEQAKASDAAKFNKEDDGKILPQWAKWLALGAGTLFIAMGVLDNMNMQDARDEYDSMTSGTEKDFDNSWSDVESYRTARNVCYGVGSGLLGLSVVLFVFD